MKLLIGFAFGYLLLGLVLGVFFREYTNRRSHMNPAEAKTTNLADLHSHTLVLGMIMFLIITLFDLFFSLSGPLFISFMCFYNVGLIGMILMLLVRGIVQAERKHLTKKAEATISGLAGLAHIFLGTGLILLFVLLLQSL